MTRDSEGLHEIANTSKPDRQADIVFIHGVGGASHSTWRHGREGEQGHFFWPEELGKDLPNCGIWSVGYPAGFTELGKPGMIIEKRAGNISHKLATAGLGHRPVVFVTHSMGGLIVKSLIVHSQTLPDENRKRIVSMVRGIVFCGTPHRGSEFADAAVVLGKFFGGSQRHVGEMRKNAEPLNTLHNEFIEWHRQCLVPVESYAENNHLFRKRRLLRPLFLRLNLVVPSGSADPNITGRTVRNVDEDHLSLVKPPNRQHDVYAGVLRFIRDVLTAARPSPESTATVAPISESARDDGPQTVRQSTPAQWALFHPYPMPPNFTGRAAERDMLSGWLSADARQPLLVIQALGGFGKSALAWYWLTHDVDPGAWPRVVWWSFYEGNARFDHFLEDVLNYLGIEKTDCQALSAHEQVEKLLQLLHTPGTLLILDGFERELRIFGGFDAPYRGDEIAKLEANDRDCISPHAERFLRGVATLPGIRAKVLLTTRLRPQAVEDHGALLLGCREEELRQMQPADAVKFFRAQGIRGTHTEIEQACEPYGYHPLSLGILAGWIVKDFEQPGDIAAAKRLDVSGDLVARQHHVLEQAYNTLTPARQKLLSRIACFRSAVSLEALQTLSVIPSPAGTRNLQALRRNP